MLKASTQRILHRVARHASTGRLVHKLNGLRMTKTMARGVKKHRAAQAQFLKKQGKGSYAWKVHAGKHHE